jgi:hypothetical protein
MHDELALGRPKGAQPVEVASQSELHRLVHEAARR